jgi:hypothetical protein
VAAGSSIGVKEAAAKYDGIDGYGLRGSIYRHVLIYTAYLPSKGDRTAAEIMIYICMDIGHIP